MISGRTSGASATSALLTDLYQLTMMQAYQQQGMVEQAVFTLSVRRLPPERNFLLACGLEDVLAFLEGLRFTDDDIVMLGSLPHFGDDYLEHLREFRFTGDVYAVPEGTPMFADEPILEIVAPLPAAQLVESFVLNTIHLQTLLASKAVRIVAAAAGRSVVDFGMRRMHGADAALKGARAFYIAGASATSNVLAGRSYGIPLAGTMAHSFIQAHASELDAFRAFVSIYPDATLLVDTYDTLAGVGNVIALAGELGDAFRVRGIRLDSGDLEVLSKAARRHLDEAGLQQVRIFASGGLDEHVIAELVAQEAPIDGFGVGTAMGVSRDRASLDMVYKLAEYAGEGRIKTSPGKPVLPGRKQVFRIERDGEASEDVIARHDEELPGTPLLRCVMRGGKRVDSDSPELARQRARRAIQTLPSDIRSLDAPARPFPVHVSGALGRLHQRIIAAIGT